LSGRGPTGWRDQAFFSVSMASRTSGSSPAPPAQRDPMTPLIAALVQVAREVAPTLES
jgi:hypothetical protein